VAGFGSFSGASWQPQVSDKAKKNPSTNIK